MRYLRFILTPTVLSLVFAYFMPLCGVTLPAGVAGLLAAVGLGISFSLVFTGYRYVEHWLVNRFAKDQVSAYNISQLAVIGSMALTGAALLGLQWLLPAYFQLAQLSSAVLGGFWLSVVGLSLSPAPALVRSFRQPGVKPQPTPEPTPEPSAPTVENPPASEGPAEGNPESTDPQS